MDKKKTAALLKADASFGDSDPTTLLQEQSFLAEKSDDRTPATPLVLPDSSIPLPAEAPLSLPVRDAGFIVCFPSIVHREKSVPLQKK